MFLIALYWRSLAMIPSYILDDNARQCYVDLTSLYNPVVRHQQIRWTTPTASIKTKSPESLRTRTLAVICSNITKIRWRHIQMARSVQIYHSSAGKLSLLPSVKLLPRLKTWGSKSEISTFSKKQIEVNLELRKSYEWAFTITFINNNQLRWTSSLLAQSPQLTGTAEILQIIWAPTWLVLFYTECRLNIYTSRCEAYLTYLPPPEL